MDVPQPDQISNTEKERKILQQTYTCTAVKYRMHGVYCNTQQFNLERDVVDHYYNSIIVHVSTVEFEQSC